mgnify:FL=1
MIYLLFINLFFNYLFFKNNNGWKSLFNGKNLRGWEIKIKGSKLGENVNNTFKVHNGNLKVSYENYNSFKDRFGHIFYTKEEFKNYRLKLSYKFTGNHLEGAPGWSIKNSGIMLHCQHPKTMLIDQEFPVSAETQLLGGLGDGERPTANICTPATDVDINNKLAEFHCINSNSKTFDDDDWVQVEVIVYSDSIVHHLIHGDTVLTYTNIRVGGDEVPDNYLNKIDQKLSKGYISLQSEGHPVEFKDIMIKKLKD